MASSGLAHNSGVHAFKDQNYEELKKEHLQAKKLFVDLAFVYKDAVKRPKDISKTPKFISKGMTRTDVVQGYLGDCWFLAAAASLTLRPQLLQQVVPPGQDFDREYAGIFHFRFWQFGKWVDVAVDDQLPVDETGKTLKYGRSTDENEFWMPLLEKAYAKLNGSFEAIIGGLARNAFVDLTGGIGETIWLSKCDPKNLCKRAENALDRKSLMAASITGKSEEGLKGLFSRHAYSITKIHKVTVEGKEITLVRLRNPHGRRGEWTGGWSDKDIRNWSKVDPKEKKNLWEEKNDGEFWMNLDDFRKVFHRLHICHLDVNAPREEGAPFRWQSSSFPGSWKRASGLNNSDAFWMNPQFLISLSKDSEILISLMQKSRKNLLPIGFAVYEVTQEYLKNPDQRRRLFSSLQKENKLNYEKEEDLTVPLELSRGDYLIIPMNEESEKGDFLLRIFTEKKHQSWRLEIM